MNTRPKPKSGYKLFERISAIVNAELEKMSDQELDDIRDCAPTLSTTNCGWTEYGLKVILSEMADSHRRHRQIQADQATEPASTSR